MKALNNYYELRPNWGQHGNWFLDTPERTDRCPLNPWIFSESRPLYFEDELSVPVRQDGNRTNFNMTTYGVWIVDENVRDLLVDIDTIQELQIIPCRTRDGTRLFVLNTLALVDCFDYEKSVRVVLNDGARNINRKGKIKSAAVWRIDPAKAAGHQIFRVKDDDLTLIVSDELRRKTMACALTGALFVPVA